MRFLFQFLFHRHSLFSNEEEVSRNRILVAMFAFAFCFLVLIIRLFYVTVIAGYFKAPVSQGLDIQKSFVVSRKEIVDRNHELLAANIATSSVYVDARMVINPKIYAAKLKKIFPSLDQVQLLKKLESKKPFIWIKRFITPKEHQKVNDAGLVGIFFETNEKRAYTYKNLFSHIIGTVGHDKEGLSGIEKYFEKNLKNSAKEEKTEPLVLSIDAALQNIVKEELLEVVNKFHAKGGAAIVQNPNNGEILAMVSLPDFNPYEPVDDATSSTFNKSTLGVYEVGSVFKAFSVAAGLDYGVTRLNDVYDVNDPIKLSKYSIKDFIKKKSWLSVPEILMYSSNIGTAQIAVELGKKNQIEFLKKLGFFNQIEVEALEKSKPLYPPENRWGETHLVTISYGNGIAVSPLHVINAFSGIINGGKLFKPTLLKIKEGETPSYNRIIKDSTSSDMRKLLRLVVKHGSGKKAGVEGYFVGGKTGTSNKIENSKYSSTARISSFVGAFPMNDPKYAIYVMLDEPKGLKETFGFATGGWTATAAVAKIVSRMATLYNIPPITGEEKEKIEDALHLEFDTSEGAK